MGPVFRKTTSMVAPFFGLTRETLAGNAGVTRWKNLPQAAPIADRRLCSKIAKASISLKHDPEKREPAF
jgi:hypothetical protein